MSILAAVIILLNLDYVVMVSIMLKIIGEKNLLAGIQAAITWSLVGYKISGTPCGSCGIEG